MKTLPASAACPARELVAFLQALSPEALPAAAVAAAKWRLLDTLGCALFGALEPCSRILAAEVLAEGSRGHSTLVGRGNALAAPAAALCNGTAAHSFELDDHLDEAIVHPGAIVVSAALAAAESADASGARLLLGIVAGYEALHRLGLALGPAPAQRGWHKTAVAGPVGAAFAASVVMGLDVSQMNHAMGLACAAASGTKAFAAGEAGMEKRMHAGRAAEAGVRMAQLAARGFTAPPAALDGRFGLLEVVAGKAARPGLLSADLGARWAVENVYVKLLPCCAWIQAAIEQLVALRGHEPLRAEQIRRVEVGVSAYARTQNSNSLPLDTMAAQFSLPYCAAAALTGDPSDPALYTPAAIADPERRALAQRIEVVVDPQMEAAYPKYYGARVALELASGERLASCKLDPHGMPGDPATEAELLGKFTRLAARACAPAAVGQLLAALRGAERLASVRELGRLLRAACARSPEDDARSGGTP